MTLPIITLIIGFLLGIGAAFVLKIISAKNARDIAAEMYRETEDQRRQQVEQVIDSVKDSFGSLSLEALSKSTEELLKLNKEVLQTQTESGKKELDSKKLLIDQQLKTMSTELERVGVLMKDLEKDRVEKFGQLDRQLRVAGEQTQALMQTTHQLREALASTKARGQWGERMAEDVLRMAGFIEGVNYQKQSQMETSRQRPDFTFYLPRNLVVNMDVKFPLDNYMKFLEAESQNDQMRAEDSRKQFFKDIRGHIKTVAGRDYIDPAQHTVDYVLLFIPNEQIYGFIHQQDQSILDDGLKQHVVFCSPITLYAVLSVIRQAVENFNLEQTSHEILGLLGVFAKQWSEFVNKMEKMGQRIDDAQKEYNALTTTRRNQLERPLKQIEVLRKQKGISADSSEDLPLLPE
ncbi:DNA recombination protein RmuC [bacterium]|nr:DNA recombination protein RmuC [bacterium]MBU1881069.1 DNA recombination protein RmuC [bacterium]